MADVTNDIVLEMKDIHKSFDKLEVLAGIDLEVRRIVDAAETRAMDILTEHKDKLVKLAEELLERETMNADEVYELLDLPKRVLSDEPFKKDDENVNSENDTPPQIPVEENTDNQGNDGN